MKDSTTRKQTNVRLPRIVCKDGFSVSIQGGKGLYSEPRRAVPGLAYKALELGFPSEADELILEYGEFYKDNHCPTDTVYAFVPVDVIAQLIQKHGGLDEEFASETMCVFDYFSPFLAVWMVIRQG